MENFEENYGFSKIEWEACLKVLTHLKDQPFNNPDNQKFGALITKLKKAAKTAIKKENKTASNIQTIQSLQKTEIVKNALDIKTIFDKPENLKLSDQKFEPLPSYRKCYDCNQSYNQLHFFYHKLCPNCAEKNYQNRFLNHDLSGQQVILTGGRIKVGYATALRLLRNNANLTITTRFPAIALASFQKEEDYKNWKDHLEIYGLDLRNLKAVKDFIEHYKSKHDQLDILINNAAQTIQYDSTYYQPLIATEANLIKQIQPDSSIVLNQTPIHADRLAITSEFDQNDYPINRFGQPVDFRSKNSWNSTLTEIPLQELLEVNLINHISPYILIQELTPLLEKNPNRPAFIINVSSSEGQFSYPFKTIFHPHTNMTKAALNMLTRTAAPEYATKNIYMNTVDVGWISTGAVEGLRKKLFDEARIPPLDPMDGSARIFHPIYEGLKKQHFFVGKLLKNYEIANW